MPSGTYHNPNLKHLFVVCTDIDGDGNVLLASVSSWKNDLCDPACRLPSGCHEFITKDSYVLYRKSRIEKATVIENGIRKGVLIQKDDFKKEIVVAALSGFKKSRQVPRKVVKYVKGVRD